MDFIAQAFKGKTKWYHYFLGSLLAFFIMQFGSFPLIIASRISDKTHFNQTTLNPGLDNNLFLVFMIIPFAFGLFGLYVSVKKINRLPFLKILTTRPKFDFKRLLFAFLLWFIISYLLIMLDYTLYPEHYVLNFKIKPFLILVFVSLLFIPLQTSFEEVLFRGYLMQGFGTAFKSRLVALIVTSIAFGLLHFANPEVEKLGNLLLIYYVSTGFLFGIITLMDEGLELSLGLHAANNVVAAIFVTTNWTVFQTDALFIDISEPKINWLLFMPVIVVYPLLILVLSKKYGWTNWKQKLMGKVNAPEVKIIED